MVGKGIAGLSAALTAGERHEVLLVCKHDGAASTDLAQGGIAAALGADDSPRDHLKDTLTAGAGLCDRHAVRCLVENGPAAVRQLIAWGVEFETDKGQVVLTREAAHRRKRIAHAGDATGSEIIRALNAQLKKRKIPVKSNSVLIELIIDNRRCCGGIFFDTLKKEYFIIYAPVTILATGGYVQMYANHTTPQDCTGDGIACAYRAGAVIRDMEFVQFHPTTLVLPQRAEQRLFLISEAVRGEGAVLRNVLRQRFMPKYHAQAELAPRDVVARAIITEMKATNSDHVLLDLSSVSLNIRERFPVIYRQCSENGIDITRDLVPVAPAAHYSMGGIVTDVWGKTSLDGLYACGECASTGVHGANRLASNSLLEGVVFGMRAGEQAKQKKGCIQPRDRQVMHNAKPTNEKVKEKIRSIMWQHVGIVRDEESLQKALQQLSKLPLTDRETMNVLCCAQLVIQGALRRCESRGSHYRKDYPKTRWVARHSYFRC